MNRVFAFLIAAVASLSASAATVYQYVGPNYASASSPYTTAQRVTGQFTTASPLAPNLPQASVLAQVTSYSFSDGVNSYASSDPNARVIEFKVATDAAGAISGWTVELDVWESGTSPHTAGDLVSSMNVIGAGDLVLDSANCSTVGTSVEGIGDSCTSTTGGSVASNLSSPGTWSIVATPVAPVAVAVPTLSEWMTLALALLLASVAAVGLRRGRVTAIERGVR